jgi:hypothetical protein
MRIVFEPAQMVLEDVQRAFEQVERFSHSRTVKALASADVLALPHNNSASCNDMRPCQRKQFIGHDRLVSQRGCLECLEHLNDNDAPFAVRPLGPLY